MTKATDQPVPQELIESIIATATWAPNHRKTQPWRFIVFEGDGRAQLARAMVDSLERRLAAREGIPDSEQRQKEWSKAFRAPVVVAVVAIPMDDPKVYEIEEVSATAAGVQNMLLACEALGLKAMWRTGDAAYDPQLKEELDIPVTAHIVGFVYIGYPEIVPKTERPFRAEDVIRWIDRDGPVA
jgi:nitroreductase